MTNTVKIPKGYLALGICLPIAVLLGYLIAEPLESSSLAVLVLVFSVLATPLLMKWYHPLMILSWNACITPFFLPGQFSIWILMALVGFGFAILNRSVNPERKFINIPPVTASLLFLAIVVFTTAMLTGGIGIHSFGATSRYGGGRYVYIFAAIAGYFALTSRRIEPNRVGIYAGMFFLPALTGLISNLAYFSGPSFYFLYALFPVGMASEQAVNDYSMDVTILRLGGLAAAAPALLAYALSRYSLRSAFAISKPFRLLLFAAAAAACIGTGFRSVLILFVMVIAFVFYLEGLHRTRWVAILAGAAFFGALIVLPNAYRLPLPVQRTLSFLPANVDPFVARSAEASSDWRLEMWKELLPDIPKYLLKGKGFSIDPNSVGDVIENPLNPYSAAIAAGDYHSGPLSILIPLGAFGMIAFLWFLAASIQTLYRYYRFGNDALRTINRFLLAFFLAKVLMFFFVFGAFYGQLFEFTGLIGLAVSLNGSLTGMPIREEAIPNAARFGMYRLRERGDH